MSEGSSPDHCFIMPGQSEEWLFVFGDHLDALRHASLAKERGEVWNRYPRLVYNTQRKGAVEAYLAAHPQTRSVVFSLEGDRREQREARELQATIERRFPHLDIYTIDSRAIQAREHERERERERGRGRGLSMQGGVAHKPSRSPRCWSNVLCLLVMVASEQKEASANLCLASPAGRSWK